MDSYKERSYRRLIAVLTWGILLTQTNFFRLKYWEGAISIVSSYLVFGLVFWTLCKYKSYAIGNKPFKGLLIMLMVLPWTGAIALKSSEGSIGSASFYLFLVLSFSMFFVFYRLRAKEDSILRIVVSFALIVFALQVFQQFRPSGVLFAQYSEDMLARMDTYAEIRNGLYRWRFETYTITLLALYHSWSKLLEHFTYKKLILVVCLFASMYLYLTRQVIFSTVVTLASSFFIRRGKIRGWQVGLLVLGAGLLFLLSDLLFGELIEFTKKESFEGNIRDLTFAYYWGRDTESVGSCLFGHGLSKDIEIMKENYMLVVTDIGIVGQWFIFGLLWIIVYFYTLFRILIKERRFVPLYIKLFLLGTFINSFWIFPYRREYEFFIWTIVLYLASIYINNNAIAKQNI